MAEETENSEDSGAPANGEFQFQRVGEKLAAEREAQGFDLPSIALKTRVPIRHLEAIEKSNFASLPGLTYTLGFARSYARALGMDAAAIGADLRNELSENGFGSQHPVTPIYEPTDPSRIPSKALAWTAAGIAAVLLIGYLVWRSAIFDGGSIPEDAAPAQAEKPSNAGSAGSTVSSPDPKGAVVLTANDTVWVRVYDAEDKRLYEKEMQKGDSFTVPADANNPMINTGRAQAIDVTIGGQKVDALAEADVPVLDIGVSAASLLARGKEAQPGATKPPSSGQ